MLTLSEGIVGDANQIQSVELISKTDSLAVQLHISSERFSALLRRQRNLTGRTGCGLCGVETVEGAILNPKPVRRGVQVTRGELHAELDKRPGAVNQKYTHKFTFGIQYR